MGLGWYTLSPGFNMIGRLIVDTVVCGLEAPSAVVGGAVTIPG